MTTSPRNKLLAQLAGAYFSIGITEYVAGLTNPDGMVMVLRDMAGDVIVAHVTIFHGKGYIASPIDDRKRIELAIRQSMVSSPGWDLDRDPAAMLAECDRLGWHEPGD